LLTKKEENEAFNSKWDFYVPTSSGKEVGLSSVAVVVVSLNDTVVDVAIAVVFVDSTVVLVAVALDNAVVDLAIAVVVVDSTAVVVVAVAVDNGVVDVFDSTVVVVVAAATAGSWCCNFWK